MKKYTDPILGILIIASCLLAVYMVGKQKSIPCPKPQKCECLSAHTVIKYYETRNMFVDKMARASLKGRRAEVDRLTDSIMKYDLLMYPKK